VWISFAQFEGNHNDADNARDVFNRSFKCLKEEQKNEDRVQVLFDFGQHF